MSAGTATSPQTLPLGFRVRLRDDVRRLEGGRLLLGGSPLRAVRLARPVQTVLTDRVLTVTTEVEARLARQLLDGNLGDPELDGTIDAADLTVVVPVRDRPEQLDRCLAALSGLHVVVVDDESRDAVAIERVAQRHTARVVRLETNVGPASARNEGLRRVQTPYVAFIDSDVEASAAVLRALGMHFTDRRVALVGPLVRGIARSVRPRWWERYDAAASSLALGRRTCSVRPGAAVGWLPSACLVGRTEVLRSMGGFAAGLRVGEDVDLVWRLVDAGHVVRYDPSHQALHDVRPTVLGWLGRKVLYGSGGAVLAQRHGDAVAPAVLAPVMGLAAAAVLLRRPWSVLTSAAAVGWGAHAVRRALPDVAGRDAAAVTMSVRGLGWAVRQEAALVTRHWWPAFAVASLASARARRIVASALVVDAIVQVTVDRPDVGPLTGWVGRRLDDLSYGAGLWLGALRSDSARCLMPRIVTSPSRRRRAGEPRRRS
ncbi:mycofactocin biosynthesis glycosyltransferase MftF [Nocardioides sp. Iso805N]|uniref:mycofactocin biosynthesis glycosyltransferase MftF n=1 Tax=Nocardioides sp. Iso805N TaxID=1283287 RepID=UPI000366D8E0|nr:mycofactocin biosynthesis glycosyltransferase MftF [Nocardioides sp. Iso805N]